MEYIVDELKFFTLWYLKAYAHKKKKPTKKEQLLHEKLVVDIRELVRENEEDAESESNLGE